MIKILTLILKYASNLWFVFFIGCTSIFKSFNNDLSSSSVKKSSEEFLKDIQNDMGNNEAPLLNAPVSSGWAQKAFIGMGSAPRGDATPTWWQPSNLDFKSSKGWSALVPWFVIYPGVGNAATNVRVKVFGITLYILDKTTNEWVKIDTGVGSPTWGSNFDFILINSQGAANKRTEPDGSISFKLSAESYPIHGGFNKMDLSKFINPLNISALFMHVTTQLVLDDPLGVDDRASAKILINIGADYYPTATTGVSDFSPMLYVPAVGGSRFGLIKSTPRNHYFATIDPPGSTNPDTPYVLGGGKVAISATDFAANMPPLANLSE